MRLQTICAALVREYKIKYHVDDENYYSSPVPSRSDITLDEYVDPLSDYDLFVSRTTPIDLGKSELDKYLEEPVMPRSTEFDILIWWKTNGIKYHLLSSIVRDILAIHVTTVASEFAFSTGGRVVSPHRNRLHPKTLEALVCVQDWLWKGNKVFTGPSLFDSLYQEDKDTDEEPIGVDSECEE
ncbi:hypothetical protein UlMin_017127 [Ulmus minor]